MFLNITNISCLISCSSDDMKYYANTANIDNFTCALCNLSIKYCARCVNSSKCIQC